MTERLTTATPEEPVLFRFRRPTRLETRVFGLGMVTAADLSGVVPHTPAAGWTVAAATIATLLRGCIRWGK
ncbi:hypothetical protein ACWGNN_44915 [Streptomyces sp. NPDC055817]|uniref:hypothetical protein n=1 Tax=Streptomyces sp. NPDC056975 TaxID=3345985 RepID=UPI0036263B87